jgi:4-amino-4-deoxy-L-arabinose transferase-like glycosyltransferase
MLDKCLRWIDTHLGILLTGLFVLRGGFLLISHIGLMGDESYYWDWSRHPDWCYFSKPPMVSWLIWVFTWLLGHYPFSVRLPAVVSGTVFLWFFHATANAFYGRRTAAFALLLVLATPANVLANLIMTIDPPLYCFWMMTLYFLRKAIFDQQQRAWIWAGFTTAAALLSKQVAIALPLMLLVFILADVNRRRWLKREFLLYLLPISLAGLPVLLWNSGHDWVMFHHSQDHFTTQISDSLAMSVKNVGELLLYQQLLMSPLIFVLILILSVRSLLRYKSLAAEQQFLVLMGPVLLLGVLLLSVEQKVQGNWPMPFYFSGLILLAAAWQNGQWRKILNFGLGMGFVMVAITYLLPNLLSVLNLEHSRLDPLKRFNSWPELVENVQIERQQLSLGLEKSFVVALGHRNLASQLAFYLPDHPWVYRYEAGGAIKTQYELWTGPEGFVGNNALVVSDTVDVPQPISRAFRSFVFLKKINNPMHASQPFYLYMGQWLEHWPSPEVKEKR